jgi:hypothetical protein
MYCYDDLKRDPHSDRNNMNTNYTSFGIPQQMELFHWATLSNSRPLNKLQICAGFGFLVVTVRSTILNRIQNEPLTRLTFLVPHSTRHIPPPIPSFSKVPRAETLDPDSMAVHASNAKGYPSPPRPGVPLQIRRNDPHRTQRDIMHQPTSMARHIRAKTSARILFGCRGSRTRRTRF